MDVSFAIQRVRNGESWTWFAWVFRPGTENEVIVHVRAETMPRVLALACLHAREEMEGGRQ
jgi:hypothetical protein